MDFNNNSKRPGNLFNKNIVNPHDVYDRILNSKNIDKYEIEFINGIVSEVMPKNKASLRKVVKYYSKNYPNDSLNWLNVSEMTNLSGLFMGDDLHMNNYTGDISMWDVSNATDINSMFA